MSWDLEDDDSKSKNNATEWNTEQDAGGAGGETEQSGGSGEIRSMDEALREAAPKTVEKGDIVTGIVAYVGDQFVNVDIGTKYEGMVPAAEFSGEDQPEVEDEIEVAVVGIDDENSRIKLSKRRADYERTWNRLLKAVETGEVVEGMVTERVKGGLRVDVGVPGFIPGSHMAVRNLNNLERFVGQSLRLKVIEAERRSKKVICSHRLVIEEERKRRKQETLNNLEEGMVCEGKVRNLTNYGAFIDLGGVDGLLHVSEMAWTRVEDPADVLSVGDTVKVAVLDVDRERERISLSRRQILPDPWKQVGKELSPGTLVDAKISRIVRTGAFAQLPEYDVEGFLPISELSERHVSEVGDVISEGEQLELKVTELRPNARRMTLSLVGAVQEKERQEVQEFMDNQENQSLTIGDQFGDLLQEAVVEEGEEKSAEGEGSQTADEETGQQPEATAETDEDTTEASEDAEREGEETEGADEDTAEPPEAADTEEDAGDDEDDEDEADEEKAEKTDEDDEDDEE